MMLFKKVFVPATLLLAFIFFILFNDIDKFKRIIVYGYKQTLKQEFVDLKYGLEKNFKLKNYPTETIIISKKDFISIQNQLSSIFENYAETGLAFDGTDKFYKVDFSNKNSINKGKIKLFGWNPDHFANKSGHGIRAKYNGQKDFGKKTVNYLKPDTRNFGLEYLFNLIFSNEFDGMLISYKPLRLFFNNIDYGFYYKEDFYDKYLIEDNKRRDEVIFEIHSVGGRENKDSIYFNHEPEDFISNFKNFINKNEKKFINEIDNNLIDLDKISALISLAISAGTNHALVEFNLRWYYNPVTNKVEPILREIGTIPYKDKSSILENFETNNNLSFESIESIEIDDIINFTVSINPFIENIYNKNKVILKEKILENFKRINALFLMDEFLNYEEYVEFLKNNPANTELEKLIKAIKRNNQMINSFVDDYDVKIYEKDKEVIFIEGDYYINEDLIFNNVNLTVDKNSKLIFSENADLIITNSIIKFDGQVNNEIILNAEAGSGSSIFVGNSDVKINYSKFYNLSNLDKGLWNLPAAITFFKSEVEILNSIFEDNFKGDDYINFYDSNNIIVKNVNFKNIYADAIDSDFSNIFINNSNFLNVNNDGIDVSGSFLKIYNSFFENIKDKAISVGERSNTSSYRNTVSKSEMGIVIKDGSIVKDSLSVFTQNNLDLVMFIKKDYYGPGKIFSYNSNYKSNLIGSEIPLSNINIGEIDLNIKENIESLLYGNLYGKASK